MAEKLYTPIAPAKKEEAVSIGTSARVSPIVGMSVRDLFRLMLIGLGIGLLTAAAAIGMNKYVFGTVLCRDGGAECTQAPLYSVIIAVVTGGIVGTILLARTRIFRPMFVVLASIFALWGFHMLSFSMVWYWALVVVALLYALAYAAFGWIARIRSFLLSLIVTVLVVVAVRLLS